MGVQCNVLIDKDGHLIYSVPGTTEFRYLEKERKFKKVSFAHWDWGPDSYDLLYVTAIGMDGKMYYIWGAIHNDGSWKPHEDGWLDLSAKCKATEEFTHVSILSEVFWIHVCGIYKSGILVHEMFAAPLFSHPSTLPAGEIWDHFGMPISDGTKFIDLSLASGKNDGDLELQAVTTDGRIFQTTRLNKGRTWSHIEGRPYNLSKILGIEQTKISSILAESSGVRESKTLTVVYKSGDENTVTTRTGETWSTPMPLGNTVSKTLVSINNAWNNCRLLTPTLIKLNMWGIMSLSSGVRLSSKIAAKEAIGKIDVSEPSISPNVTREGLSIDASKCNNCQECIRVCPTSLFMIKNNKAILRPDAECVGCSACIAVCTPNAITR